MKESFRGIRRSGDIKAFKGQKNLFSLNLDRKKNSLKNTQLFLNALIAVFKSHRDLSKEFYFY